MRRYRLIIPLLAAAAAALGLPAAAGAAFTASIDDSSAVLTGDDANDSVTVTVNAGGQLVHGLTTVGVASTADWDTSTPDEQTVDAAGTTVSLLGGGGDDNLAFGAGVSAIAAAILEGGAGNDLLTGSDKADQLRGDDANDRLVGGRGNDDVEGGNGNDTLVWNNGDGSDVMDGDAGNDAVEVNGAPTAGDEFTIKPNAERVRFDRVNLGLFNLDIGSTERMEVNGLGGGDEVTVDNGLGAVLLTLAGGAGADTITGGDVPELIHGGDDADVLSGGAGDDRIVGDRANDTMRGGAGDDALVWNNGDGSDVMDGDEGFDAIEVNGAFTQGDAFTLAPNGTRAKFDRTNLGPFTLDIGSAETLALNTRGGDDTFAATDGTSLALVADGGSGNDTLTGASTLDTISGGSGDDRLTGGGGLDALDGRSGNDRIEARDGASDLVRCGEGNDTAIADQARVDALDACETVDRLPEAAARGRATLQRATGSRRRGRRSVSFRIACADGPCVAILSVRTARTVRVRGARARLLLAERTVTLAAGETRTFRLTLPRRAERAAKRRVLARMASDGTITQRRVRLR